MNVHTSVDQSKGKKKKVASLPPTELFEVPQKKKKKSDKLTTQSFTEMFNDTEEFVEAPQKKKKKSKQFITQEDFSDMPPIELAQSPPKKKKKAGKLHTQDDFSTMFRDNAEFVQTPSKKKKVERLHSQEDKLTEEFVQTPSKKKKAQRLHSQEDRLTEEFVQTPSKKKKAQRLHSQEDRLTEGSESTPQMTKKKLAAPQSFFDQLYGVSGSGVSGSESTPQMTKKKLAAPQSFFDQLYGVSGSGVSETPKSLKKLTPKKKKTQDKSFAADLSLSPKNRKDSPRIQKKLDISTDSEFTKESRFKSPKRREKSVYGNHDDDDEEDYGVNSIMLREDTNTLLSMKKEGFSSVSVEDQHDDDDDDDLYSSLDDIEPEKIEDITFKEESFGSFEENKTNQNEIKSNHTESIPETSAVQHNDPLEPKTDLEFLQYFFESLSPTNSTYTLDIAKFDFETFGKDVHMNPDECHSLLKALIKKTPKVKCLHQVVTETLVHLHESKDPLRAAFTKKSLQMKEKKFGKLPVMIFFEKEKEKEKEKNNSECKCNYFNVRQKFGALKISKKIKYTIKSVELLMELRANDPTLDMNSENIVQPSMAELKLLLEYYNFPEFPPKLPAHLYFKERPQDFPHLAESMTKMIKILTIFRSLDRAVQDIWDKKHKQVLSQFQDEVVAWKAKQNPNLGFAADLYLEKVAKGPKKKLTERILNSLVYITMLPLKIQFPDEPPAPPLNKREIFKKEMKSGEEFPSLSLKKAYSKLSKEEKRVYEKKATLNRSLFVGNLIRFVDGLSEDQRRIYLGTRRVKIIKLLKEDIFATKYPSNSYPAYSLPTSPNKKSCADEKLSLNRFNVKSKTTLKAASNPDDGKGQIKSYMKRKSLSTAKKIDISADSDSEDGDACALLAEEEHVYHHSNTESESSDDRKI